MSYEQDRPAALKKGRHAALKRTNDRAILVIGRFARSHRRDTRAAVVRVAPHLARDDEPMKVAVVGLGAVGGLIAARLCASGHQVAALARGKTLANVRERGLIVEAGGMRSTARIEASDDAASLGQQELLVVALKAPSLTTVAPTLAPLIGTDTIVLPAMNGISWWFNPTGEADSPPLAERRSRRPTADFAAARARARLRRAPHGFVSRARAGAARVRRALDRRRAARRRLGARRRRLPSVVRRGIQRRSQCRHPS